MSDPSTLASLKPAFFIHLDTPEEPKLIYSNDSGSSTLVKVSGGYTKTLDPKYPFDTTVDFGIDNLSTKSNRDQAIQNLDCQLYLTSKKNGGGIHFVYSGVAVHNDKSVAVISNTSKESQYSDFYLTNHPKAYLDKSNTDEAWIEGKNLIGKGRFLRNDQGKLSVEYYVYVLE